VPVPVLVRYWYVLTNRVSTEQVWGSDDDCGKAASSFRLYVHSLAFVTLELKVVHHVIYSLPR